MSLEWISFSIPTICSFSIRINQIKTPLLWLEFRSFMLQNKIHQRFFFSIFNNISLIFIFLIFFSDKNLHHFGLDLREAKLCLVEQITSIGKNLAVTILKRINYALWTTIKIQHPPLRGFHSIIHPLHPDYFGI